MEQDARLLHIAHLLGRTGRPVLPLPRSQIRIAAEAVRRVRAPYQRQKHPAVPRLDDVFYLPQSRHTEVRRKDIEPIGALDLVCESQEAGVGIVMTRNGRQIFITGHGEYDPDTLLYEYQRDIQRGMDNVAMPRHYFPHDDPHAAAHGALARTCQPAL